MKPSTDHRLETLIHRIADGDRTALRALYNEAAPQLLGLAIRLLADRAEAEATLQDAFITVWQDASRFDPRRNTPEIWLVATLRRAAYERLRSRGREPSLEDEPASDSSHDQGELETLITQLGDERLRHCLDELESGQRATILLAYLNGLSQSQMADRLMVPLDIVRQRVREGLESLRRCLS